MADNNRAGYEYKTVKAIRGLEARTQTKLEKDGWELISTDRSEKLRTEMTFSRAKKKVPAKAIIATGLAVVVLAGIITLGVIFGDEDTQVAQAEPSASSTSDVAVESETNDADSPSTFSDEDDAIPDPSDDSESETPTESVADVEARWLDIMQIERPTDLINQDGYDFQAPLHLIHPGWEGSTTGYLRIAVQEELTEDSVQRLGINIMNLLGSEYPDLEGVIFTDSAGINHNFYRREAPMANLD